MKLRPQVALAYRSRAWMTVVAAWLVADLQIDAVAVCGPLVQTERRVEPSTLLKIGLGV